MDRKLSIDLLKIAMAICVVAIHVNPLDGLPEDGAFLHGALARVAVPVFFLINGYFFETIARQGGTRIYVARLLRLFAIWTVLYLPAWSWALSNPEVWQLVRFLGMGWWHLWYLPALALAAALGAVMQGWPVSRQLAAMAASFLTGVGLVYGLAFDLLHPSQLVFGDMTVLHRNGLFLGLPFFLAGMLIRRSRLEQRFSVQALAIIAASALAMLVAEGWFLGNHATELANHDNLLMLGLASPALFLFALKFKAKSPSRTLGTYANGLFFIHVAFCVAGFRLTEWPKLWIFGVAVLGSLAVTFALIRSGLDRKLL